MIGKLGQIAIQSGDQKPFQLWSEYDEMKRLRKEAAQDRELKRSDRSRAPPERFVKSYSHAVQSTLTKNSSSLKILKTLLILNKKTNGLKQ